MQHVFFSWGIRREPVFFLPMATEAQEVMGLTETSGRCLEISGSLFKGKKEISKLQSSKLPLSKLTLMLWK